MARREVELLRRACSRHDACAERLADFDRRNPDAACGAGDEQSLTRFEPRPVLKAYVSGAIGNRKRGGLQEIHLRRHLEDLCRRDRCFLREITKSGVADDPVAYLQMIDPAPDLKISPPASMPGMIGRGGLC